MEEIKLAVTNWYDTKTFEVKEANQLKKCRQQVDILGFFHFCGHLDCPLQGKARQVYLYNIFQHKAIQSALQNVKTLRA